MEQSNTLITEDEAQIHQFTSHFSTCDQDTQTLEGTFQIFPVGWVNKYCIRKPWLEK